MSKLGYSPLWSVFSRKDCIDNDGFLPEWPVMYSHCDNDFGSKLRSYYDWMLKQQGGGCAICKQYRTTRNWNYERMQVDHNHVTGEIRGILCHWCNMAIGYAGDNIEYDYGSDRKCVREPIKILNSAIDYLNKDRTGYPVYTRSFRNNDVCDELRKELNGFCQICGNPETVSSKKKNWKNPNKPNKLAVDHDHSTGLVRGLLCTKCNAVLGMAQDSVDILKRAIHYIRFAPYW